MIQKDIYWPIPKTDIKNKSSKQAVCKIYTTPKKLRINCSIIFELVILNVCSHFERDGNCIKL